VGALVNEVRQAGRHGRIALPGSAHRLEATICDDVNIAACQQREQLDQPGNVLVREATGARSPAELQPLDMFGGKSNDVGATSRCLGGCSRPLSR
jgi:hypothetical protein